MLEAILARVLQVKVQMAAPLRELSLAVVVEVREALVVRMAEEEA